MTPDSQSSTVVGEDLVDSGGCVVAIVGSRSFPKRMWPTKCANKVGEVLVDAGWPVRKVVSGGADGVDSAAGAWANLVRVPLYEIEPDWDKHGRAAGVKRNTTIVQEADKLVALWNGSSRGTMDSIGKARTILGDENVVIEPIGDAGPELNVTAVPRKEIDSP
jgi:hypothetical protein